MRNLETTQLRRSPIVAQDDRFSTHAVTETLRGMIAMIAICGAWTLRPIYMGAITTAVIGRTLLVIGGVGLLRVRDLVTRRSLVERADSIV